MFGAIVWIGLGADDLGYAILGLVGRTGSSVWAFGVMILALNFGVWSWALHLLL